MHLKLFIQAIGTSLPHELIPHTKLLGMGDGELVLTPGILPIRHFSAAWKMLRVTVNFNSTMDRSQMNANTRIVLPVCTTVESIPGCTSMQATTATTAQRLCYLMDSQT
jgi:hypothetical protein